MNWNAQAPAEETAHAFRFPLHLARVSKTQGKADECVFPVSVPGLRSPAESISQHTPGGGLERRLMCPGCQGWLEIHQAVGSFLLHEADTGWGKMYRDTKQGQHFSSKDSYGVDSHEKMTTN